MDTPRVREIYNATEGRFIALVERADHERIVMQLRDQCAKRRSEYDDLANRFAEVKRQRNEAWQERDEARAERDKERAQGMLAHQSNESLWRTLREKKAEINKLRQERDEAYEREGRLALDLAKAQQKADRSDQYRGWWLTARRERDNLIVERNQLCDQVKNLTEIVTKQQSEMRACQRLDGLTAAEAKIADIGWRKNRLVEAIAAKGFVVRWQKDGTPEVLTKEEAAERDKQKEERTRILREKVLENMTFMDFVMRNAFPFRYGPAMPSAPEPLPAMRRGAVNYYNKDGTPAPNPLAAPQGDAQAYYERAMQRVYGAVFPLSKEGWAAVRDPDRANLDAALAAELLQRCNVICKDDHCTYRPCVIYRKRPWRRA